MAIVQFVPEMQRKCLKLTLHLPYPELKMTGNMLLSGLILILVCFASNFLLMEVYLNGILAHELKEPHIAHRFNVVSCRDFRLPARRMDLP